MENFKKEEQAAGFAPFTRGYEAYNFHTTCIEENKKPSFEFELTDFSAQAIAEIFKKNSHSKLSEEIPILIAIPFGDEMIIATKVLRTLLAFVNLKMHKNASHSKFIFYAKSNASHTLLLEYHFATASQINFLITAAKSKSLVKLLPTSPEPIDSTYGNDFLEQSVANLVTEIWKKIGKF